MSEPNQIHQTAQIEELQLQRAFLGDRAVNLASELASVRQQLAQALAQIAKLETSREPERDLKTKD